MPSASARPTPATTTTVMGPRSGGGMYAGGGISLTLYGTVCGSGGHVPRQRGDRIDDPGADVVVHASAGVPRGGGDPVHDLRRRQVGEALLEQRGEPGDVRGGERRAADRDRTVLTLQRVDRVAVVAERDEVLGRVPPHRPTGPDIEKLLGWPFWAMPPTVSTSGEYHAGRDDRLHLLPAARIGGHRGIGRRVLAAVLRRCCRPRR